MLEEVAAYCHLGDGPAGPLPLHPRGGVHRLAHPPPDEDHGQARREARRQADRDRAWTCRPTPAPTAAHCLTVPMNACSKSLPLLLCDNVALRRARPTTPTSRPPAPTRATARRRARYALQLACAELAAELGMDHLAFLEKNRVREGTMLEILRCLGEGREGTPQEVVELRPRTGARAGRAHDRVGHARGERRPRRAHRQGRGDHPAGLRAAGHRLGQRHGHACSATAPSCCSSGGTDLGTGLDTLVVKIVAECLCTRIERRLADRRPTPTSRPTTTGAYASSGHVLLGQRGAATRRAR